MVSMRDNSFFEIFFLIAGDIPSSSIFQSIITYKNSLSGITGILQPLLKLLFDSKDIPRPCIKIISVLFSSKRYTDFSVDWLYKYAIL